MKKSADWIAWCLQFVFGFAFGVGMGLLSLRHGRLHSGLPSDMHMRGLLLGAGLIGAAIASRYGDRFWIGDNYRAIPPDEPQTNRLSRAISLFAGIVGGGVLLFALIGK